MEISSAVVMDRGKRCQRPRRGSAIPRAKPRRSSSTVRVKRRGAPLVDVSGRRASVEEIPVEVDRGNVVDHVADANGVGPPNPAHHGGEDFVCDLLQVFPEPAASMILPPIPSPAEGIHFRAHAQ